MSFFFLLRLRTEEPPGKKAVASDSLRYRATCTPPRRDSLSKATGLLKKERSLLKATFLLYMIPFAMDETIQRDKSACIRAADSRHSFHLPSSLL